MSLSDRAYSEKRDFIRMRVETPVVVHHDGQQTPATCLDLSSTGMQVQIKAQLAHGARVTVHIPSDHNELRGLDAEAEVVRVSDMDDGRQMLGLAILSMR